MARKDQPARTRAKRRAALTETCLYEAGQHPVHAYLNRIGDGSARVMGSAIDSIADILSNGKIVAETLAWHRIRAEHVSLLRGRLQKLYAPATANRYLTALRAVLKEAWRLELIDRETMERALDVAPVKGSREPRGRAVVRDDLRAVFAVCAADEKRNARSRDAAILALLYGCGLRRAETAGLELEQFDPAEGALHIHGKGNKARTVYLPNGAMKALDAWLAVRGREPGPLFCRLSKTGEIRRRPISAQLIYRVVLKRHSAAGVEPFTPHDLRRSFISELLDEGVDLATIARQVGHANVQTTARYDRRDARAQQKAARRVAVPFDG